MKKTTLAFLSICAISSFFILYFIYKYRLFHKVVVKEVNINPGSLVYTQYKGDYYQIKNTFENSKNSLNKHFGSNIKMFGIYYDNPQQVANRSDCRAVVGAILESSQETDKFLAKNPSFEFYKFTSLMGFGSEFSLFNNISMMVAIIKGYPAIRKFFGSNKIAFDHPCFFEIYDFTEGKMMIATINAKDNKKLTSLSKYDAPKLKAEYIKKNN